MKDQFTAVRSLLLEVLGPWHPPTAQRLTLLPLFGSAPAPDYVIAAQAISEGLLTISEIDQAGSVPQLIADNLAPMPVLLLDGEHLEGAKQNRVMNSSALLAANHKTVLPVSCVEQGRWHYNEDQDFRTSSDFSHTRLRARNKVDVVHSVRTSNTRDVDQGAVWDEVEEKRQELGAFDSLTGAMSDAFDNRRSQIDEILAAYPSPANGQTGVMACVGGAVIALDCFDKPETLEQLWTRLVSGYAMDALEESPSDVSEETVKAFLADAAAAEGSLHEGIGVGFDIALSGRVTVGNALVLEDSVVHLAIFPNDAGDSQTNHTGSRIERPRARRSRLPHSQDIVY